MVESGAPECDPGPLLEKLERMIASKQWSQWLDDTMQAFAAALMGIAERRASDVVAALFLAQVGSSVYASARILGASEEEAFKEAGEALCSIYKASLRLLDESRRRGALEEHFRRVSRELGGVG